MRRVACALAVLALAMAPHAQSPTSSSIRGIVRDDRGTPLPNVRVGISSDHGRTVRSTLTGLHGEYRLVDVPPGRYTLHAIKSGYAPLLFGQLRASGVGTMIPIRSGESRALDLVLPRGGTISGVVRDGKGQPLPGIWVRAHSPPFAGFVSAQHTTNARGEYRLWGLPRGAYIIGAGSDHEYAGEFVVADPAGKERAYVFRTAFYPNTTNVAEAAVVNIEPGQDERGRDIVIPMLAAGRISGRILNNLGILLERGSVRLQHATNAVIVGNEPTATPDASGRVEFNGVPVGRYTLVFQALSRTAQRVPQQALHYWAARDVIVTADETADVELMVMEGARISGRLDFVGMPLPDSTQVWPRVETIDGPFFRAHRGGYGERRDGAAFAVAGVAPGLWSLGVVAPSPWWLQSVMVGDRDALDEPLSIGSNESIENVRAILTNATSGISGEITGSDGSPRFDHEVIIFPLDRRYWRPQARRIRIVQPDFDGHFAVLQLPAGEYGVAVNRDSGLDISRATDALEALLAGAVRAAVRLGETTQVRLRAK